MIMVYLKVLQNWMRKHNDALLSMPAFLTLIGSQTFLFVQRKCQQFKNLQTKDQLTILRSKCIYDNMNILSNIPTYYYYALDYLLIGKKMRCDSGSESWRYENKDPAVCAHYCKPFSQMFIFGKCSTYKVNDCKCYCVMDATDEGCPQKQKHDTHYSLYMTDTVKPGMYKQL